MKRVTERQKGMPRLNAVVNHEVYQTYYKRICECETDRVFCCHQMNHLLDVARIAYIKNLEEGLGFDKELIYVAAVLHDIGKSFQYRQQIPHEIAGERIARRILDSLPTGFTFTDSLEPHAILHGNLRLDRRERVRVHELDRIVANVSNSKIIFSRCRRRYTHIARTICLCDISNECRRARAHQEALGRDLVVARQIVAQMHACFIRPERHRAFCDRGSDGIFDAFWSTEWISGTGEIMPVDLSTDVIR